MAPKTRLAFPARLARLRQRFEQWRRTHRPRSRIPGRLWKAAVKMAGVYGSHRTAKTLRLDYYALQKRMQREASVNRGTAARRVTGAKAEAGMPFLELPPPLSLGASECILEWESAAGAKMRVQLKGVVSPGAIRRMVVAALSRSFGDSQS